jgi:hypothetical protein
MPEPNEIETPPTTPQAQGDPPADARRAEPDDEALREAGRRALDAERRTRADAEKRAKAAEAELAALREAHATDAEKTLLAAKREERDRVLAEAQTAIDAATADARLARLEAAIVRKALDRFYDMDDVLGEIARDASVVLTEDGRVTGLDAALRELEKRKPHWVRRDGDRGAIDYGAPAAGRNGSPASGRTSIDQLTEQMRQAGMGVRI